MIQEFKTTKSNSNIIGWIAGLFILGVLGYTLVIKPMQDKKNQN